MDTLYLCQPARVALDSSGNFRATRGWHVTIHRESLTLSGENVEKVESDLIYGDIYWEPRRKLLRICDFINPWFTRKKMKNFLTVILHKRKKNKSTCKTGKLKVSAARKLKIKYSFNPFLSSFYRKDDIKEKKVNKSMQIWDRRFSSFLIMLTSLIKN